jgi:tetratricopeptide (TPR) repeat protein
MRIRFGFILTLGLVWLALTLFGEARDAMKAEVPDTTRVVALFAAIVVVGLVTGIAFVTTWMPDLAEWAANLFLNPNQKLANTPETRALAALGERDFESALEHYKEAWESNPSDEHLLAEITKIACDKLQEPQAAASFYENALDADLTVEEACAVRLQLAQIAGLELGNVSRARELLSQVVAAMPNTRYSANANHLLGRLA